MPVNKLSHTTLAKCPLSFKLIFNLHQELLKLLLLQQHTGAVLRPLSLYPSR